jgi:hypothetical protein
MSKPLSFLSNKNLERLRKMNLIKEARLVHIQIREDFKKRRVEVGPMKAINQLAEEYHLAFETVRNICYAKEELCS